MLLLPVLVISACTGPAATSSHPSPSAATPGASSVPSFSTAEILFAVLEARGAHGQMGPQPGVQDAHDRVAIVGLDGVARVRADFTPRPIPVVGNAAPLLQPEARVASGRVFYLDGGGKLRELTSSGSRQVAILGLKPQQEISFSVSPDGKKIEASRLTFPPVNPNPTSPGDTFLSDRYDYELLAADSGGSPRRITASTVGGNAIAAQPLVIGWDGSGVIATTANQLGTQNGTQGRVLWGHAAHLDGSGRPVAVLGGSDCSVISIVSKAILCLNEQSAQYSVRSLDGAGLWSLPPTFDRFYTYLVLSPDGARIAYTGGVRGRDGSSLKLAANFNPEGWLDNQTLIGITGENNQQEMAVVRFSSPQKVDDLGFKGEFVGVVHGG